MGQIAGHAGADSPYRFTGREFDAASGSTTTEHACTSQRRDASQVKTLSPGPTCTPTRSETRTPSRTRAGKESSLARCRLPNSSSETYGQSVEGRNQCAARGTKRRCFEYCRPVPRVWSRRPREGVAGRQEGSDPGCDRLPRWNPSAERSRYPGVCRLEPARRCARGRVGRIVAGELYNAATDSDVSAWT